MMINPDVRGIYDSFPLEEKIKFLNIMNITSIDAIASGLYEYYTNDEDDRLERHAEFRIHRTLRRFLPPFIFTVGIIGNTLSFVILSQRTMRLVSTYAYLTVLTFADTMVLFSGLLRIWIAELTGGSDFRVWSQWSCKLTNVVGTTVSDYSGWLIIAVTAERFLAVCYPLKAPMVCSRRRAYLIMVGLLVFLLLFNVHMLWTSELISQTNVCGQVRVHCESSPDFKYLGEEVWPWMDAFVYSFIPFVVILTLNVLIVRKVVMSRRHRDAQLCRRSVTMTPPSEKSARMSVMLVTISFAFLVTTLPMNVTVIVNNSVNFQGAGRARMKLGRTITELLMYVNHSINFFLYCATGQKFRRELCAIVCYGGGRRRRRGMRRAGVTSRHSDKAAVKRSSARDVLANQ